ncbi:MAG: protein-L-isoaspartate O-methyltransferase [Alphaproteobacteria bacterium]|nr:protein-L-isoaspartate O-methyltransferase [Alphaproteobacteria bacterium]
MDFAAARFNMVESQIRTNRVIEPRIVRALGAVPREMFVSKPMRAFAYVDEDLDVGAGRVVMKPLILAKLLEAAGIKDSDVVLNIGDCTGYVTAVLARLAQTVVSIEADPEMVARSGQTLTSLGVDNAAVVQGPYGGGYPAQAPFDVIFLSGAMAEIPVELRRQLADGGRLVGVVDDGKGVGRGTVLVRVGDSWGSRVVFDGTTARLPMPAAKPVFRF